ncbi:HWE histidine kinase domain-containing protein [Caulobacter sp. 17J80-11]|uniref:HWE histidine kinase domain-containing protein n=1 Tax=Caulobacter sp. 17J80-11 TaxID=2763502 RepID=UPI0016537B04|nr:HWE histidine kinase domain-containing protein [Caulobacter sp. 17J80-11]MBC6982496.1 MASE1 domain-containing protein [Caulobacter sp. 17J80-11]
MAIPRQRLVGVVAFLAAYTLLSYAGLQWTTSTTPVSQVWPASGVAIAGLLIGGLRLWPVVFVGALAAGGLDRAPYPVALSVLMAAGNTAASAASVWGLQRLGMDRCLRRPRDMLNLTFVGGLGSGAISALIAVLGLMALTGMSRGAAEVVFARWTLGDMLGVVVVAPAILTWARPEPLSRERQWWLIFAGLLAATAVMGWAAYVAPDHPGGIYPMHLVPVLILTAFLLDARATTTVTLFAAALALFGALTGSRTRAGLQWLGDEQFVTIMAFTLAVVAIMTENLRRARSAMEDQRLYRLTAENEERLRMSQEIGRVGSWDWDARTGHAVCSATFCEIFGWPREKPYVTFGEWAGRVHPDDRDQAIADVRGCMEGLGSCDRGYRIELPSGAVRHIESRARVMERDDGRALRLLGVVQDVTERKEAEEHQRLLMREVDHRAKNALAVVQAVVRLTKAETREAFAAAVEGRIQAIARAHDLLAASRWTGASLGKLAEEEVEAYQGVLEGGRRRIRLDGPEFMLRPDAAQPIALVLHELVTNAAKHGALSVPGGSVDLSWSVDREAGRLKLVWSESGGPQVPEARGKGFGSVLVQASVERQLNGVLRHAWRAEGLQVELEIPLTRTPRRGGAAPGDAGAQPLLLVEDEALVGLDMKERLEGLGWRVVGPIADVEEALRAIDVARPAAAVLDANLGGLSSTPIAERLDALDVPFVFATGYGDYANGAGDFDAPVLVKPITTEELAQVLLGLGVVPPERAN